MYFHSINANFCFDRTYISVSRVNAGENSNVSFQLRAELLCVSPVIYRFVCIEIFLKF